MFKKMKDYWHELRVFLFLLGMVVFTLVATLVVPIMVHIIVNALIVIFFIIAIYDVYCIWRDKHGR